MKKLTLVFAFMLAVAGAAAQSMYVHKTDGNVYEFKVSDVDSINFAASTTDDYLYTVTYMPNGTVGDMIIDTVRYGRNYTFREQLYVKEWNTRADGSGAGFTPKETIPLTRNLILYAILPDGYGVENGYYYVDLGLPSGLKWATCNVGATAAGRAGNYYAWGETEPKTTYSWATYKWCNGSSSTFTKYNTKSSYGTVDNKTVLDLADDAARANWGGQWRMPTKEECEELLDNCTLKWVYSYKGTGVAGRIVTSNINGNSIFLPAAGCRNDDVLNDAGRNGIYWSSSLYAGIPNDVWDVYFSSGYVSMDYGNRVYGRSVRPVL